MSSRPLSLRRAAFAALAVLAVATVAAACGDSTATLDLPDASAGDGGPDGTSAPGPDAAQDGTSPRPDGAMPEAGGADGAARDADFNEGAAPADGGGMDSAAPGDAGGDSAMGDDASTTTDAAPADASGDSAAGQDAAGLDAASADSATADAGAPDGAGADASDAATDPCQAMCDHILACTGQSCAQLNITCPVGTACVDDCVTATPCNQLGPSTPQACQAACSDAGAAADAAPVDSGANLQACGTCLNQSCQTELQACAQNAACGAWLQCVQGCAGASDPSACLLACDAANPGAAAGYDGVYACACASCGTECAALSPCSRGDGG